MWSFPHLPNASNVPFLQHSNLTYSELGLQPQSKSFIPPPEQPTSVQYSTLLHKDEERPARTTLEPTHPAGMYDTKLNRILWFLQCKSARKGHNCRNAMKLCCIDCASTSIYTCFCMSLQLASYKKKDN